MSGLFLSIFQYKVHLGLLVSAYESITIDELKEQTNNLLDRVTEEQHPLRVFMNDSKVLLLFPQDLLAPICDSNFRLILLSAMRYAMDRNTYMPIVVADYIKRHRQFLDDKFLVLATDDIRRQLEEYHTEHGQAALRRDFNFDSPVTQ